MIIITEDDILIKNDVKTCRIEPTGGPDDPVLINGIELDNDELYKLQLALLVFLKTGFFQ